MGMTLVVCAGHAVYCGSDFIDPKADGNWFLQSFQRGEPPFYIGHMKAAVSEAEDDNSVLVFSGGQTRKEAGPISEALSYWRVSNHHEWWNDKAVMGRALTEEYARDSFENLLFSVARFREFVGHYPHRIVVVSWGFKEERFHLHREAMRFPKDHFKFVGANNPEDLVGAMKGEAKAIAAFKADPYGANGDLLGKRQIRDPFRRAVPYPLSAPEMVNLLCHRGPHPFDGSLPW